MSSPDNPDQTTQPNGQGSAGSSCPACAKPLTGNATRCPNCGLALGEHQRCPHCHTIADVEASAEARFVCSVCGGVRIPIEDEKVARSTDQLDLLKRATSARSARTVWRFVAILVAASGIFSALVLWVTLKFAQPPTVAVVVAGLAVLVPIVFSLFAWQRSRACAAGIEPALDRAWRAAAADIARARGGELDAAELARQTRIAEREADQLLARMSAESVLASSVTADGNLKYTLVETRSAEPVKPLPAAR